MNVVNFIISKDLLENRIKDGAGLLNPLSYYLAKVGIYVVEPYTRSVRTVQWEGRDNYSPSTLFYLFIALKYSSVKI